MKQYVFTMKEDVCSLNGKTDAQKEEVLKVLSHYGTVEDYEVVIAGEREKYQAVIDNQSKQIEAIKDQDLTDDEMKIVNMYRECKKSNDAQHLSRINDLVNQLEAVRNEQEKRNAQIKAILGE
jgi:hypothetical protein